ncbi:MAG: hypothetical protein AAF787_02185 [Chloroflexota bacterium]
MNLKRLLTTTAAAALLAGGVMTAGAQDTTEEPPPSTQAEEDTGRRGSARGPRAIGGSELRALVEQYTGLSGRELRESMRDDATLASLIEANGENVDSFIEEATALAEARIDEAVENGRVDAERAETLKSELNETITTMVNSDRPIRDGLRGRGGPGGRLGGLMNEETAALIESYTGMEPQAVVEALRDGDTLASLIEANGGDVDAFVTEMTAIAEARIDERAATMKENLPTTIEDFVNGEGPLRAGPRALRDNS